MNDQGKTKEQLINELEELREELALFKALSSENIQIARVLRDFKELYEKFYKSNPHPMWIYDLETLAFLDVNDAAIKHYGYSQEEFLSMTIKDIRPPEDIPALLENITKATKGLDTAGICRHIKKDGTLIYVEIISHTMTFSGRRAEIVLVFDITERKQMEEKLQSSEERFRLIAKRSIDFIFQIDLQGIITYRSPSIERYGYTLERVIGTHFESYVLASDIPKAREAFQRVISGEHIELLELQLLREDKTPIHTETNLTPIIKDGKIIGVQGITRDITERKKVEETLKIGVGRELGMNQLKEENEKLKQELEKYRKQ